MRNNLTSCRTTKLAVSIALLISGPGFGQTVQGWPSAGFDIQNRRWASTETKLSAGNVSGLILNWTFITQDDVAATPSVDTGANAVYFPDWSGSIYKVNASTGNVIWTKNVVSSYLLPAGSFSRTTPTLSGSTVVLGTGSPTNPAAGAYIIAVDSSSGTLLWKTQIDPSSLALMTGSPVIFNGLIYFGVSSAQENLNNPTFRGSIVAVSLATGQKVWQTYVVPPGYGGGPVWSSTPAVDATRQQLYVTTGNNYLVPQSVQNCEIAAHGNKRAIAACQAPDNYVDSILALDLATGTVKWSRKCAATDAWIFSCNSGSPSCPKPTGKDIDFGSGANLFTVSTNGGSVDLVGAGQKSGVYWALNPDSGAVVWKQVVGPGGLYGGIQWGTATDDGRIYIAISNSANMLYTLQPSGIAWNGGSWAALDAATGSFIWQVKNNTQDPLHANRNAMALGPVTIANGVLYCGSMSGSMYALDAGSGTALWSFLASGSVNSAPAVVNGVLYWGSGYSHSLFGPPIGTPGRQFYSFTLPPNGGRP